MGVRDMGSAVTVTLYISMMDDLVSIKVNTLLLLDVRWNLQALNRCQGRSTYLSSLWPPVARFLNVFTVVSLLLVAPDETE